MILAVLKIFVGGIHSCSTDLEISADFSRLSSFTAENVVDLPRKIDRNQYKTDNLLSLKVDNKVVYCNE